MVKWPNGCVRAAVSKPLDRPVMACPVDMGADDAREPLHGLGELTVMDERHKPGHSRAYLGGECRRKQNPADLAALCALDF